MSPAKEEGKAVGLGMLEALSTSGLPDKTQLMIRGVVVHVAETMEDATPYLEALTNGREAVILALKCLQEAFALMQKDYEDMGKVTRGQA